MDKPATLRQLITESVPELVRNPDKLKIYVKGGSIATRFGGINLGFQYGMTLHIEVRDYSGHPDTIFLPIALWLRVNQPDLLLNLDKADEAISFEADYLDNETVDIDITMKLTESVDVLPYTLPDNGGQEYRMTHRAEPGIIGTEELVSPPPLLKRIYDQDGRFVAGYPIIYFLTGEDGAMLLGSDGAPLTDASDYG
jgi:hypothetical protein